MSTDTRVKFLEIRDEGTFIPALAVEMSPGPDGDEFLLCRAGYGGQRRLIMLTSLNGGRTANYDPYSWGSRTWHVAHTYIEKEWENLLDGAVIDVEWILGVTASPKVSERTVGHLA